MWRQVDLFIRQEQAGNLLHAGIVGVDGVGAPGIGGLCWPGGHRGVGGGGRGTAEFFEEVGVAGGVEVDMCGI